MEHSRFRLQYDISDILINTETEELAEILELIEGYIKSKRPPPEEEDSN